MGQGFSPLDREKGIRGGWSEKGLEQVLWATQALSSYQEAEEALERLGGLTVSRSKIHRLVQGYGGLLAERRQEEVERLWASGVCGEEIPAPREGQKSALGISLDGMKVWVGDGWHKVKVASCFEFGPGKDGEVGARRIGYWASYGEVEVFRRTVLGYAYHRGLGLEGKAIVLGDGALWIKGFAGTYCPKRVRIVDWNHAMEHVWALGKEALGEGAVEERLWQGDVEGVVQRCEALLATRLEWREENRRAADYFRERAEQRVYPSFRAAGYPIGSGTVESAFRGISWRCRNRERRWKRKGLVAILALRSAGMGGKSEWEWAWEQICQADWPFPTILGHTQLRGLHARFVSELLDRLRGLPSEHKR